MFSVLLRVHLLQEIRSQLMIGELSFAQGLKVGVYLKLFKNVKIGFFAYLVSIWVELLLGQKVFENSNFLYCLVASYLT